MKPDEDNCWYNGRHEFCKETYPGQYEWCSAEYHRCVECTDDGHCPPERPWCDWDMECEECLVTAHCATGESCLMRNGRWVCRRKDCVDYREEGDYDYCANNFRDAPICDTEKRRCVECIHPSDCEGAGQTCINSKCVDESEMDCVQQIEAGFLNYCEITFPERPVCHTRLRDCVECQFDNQCGADETCSITRCVPKEWECEGPEDCLSDDYKCIKHECIKKDCSDYDDPDAYCSERKREGWRCLGKVCVRCIDPEDCPEGQSCANNKCRSKTCDEYSVPDWWCRDHFGENFKCIDKECKDISERRKCSEYLSTADAREYCESLDPEKPHCDFDTGLCHECNLEQHCLPHWKCWNHSCRECFNDDDCYYIQPRWTYKCSGEPDWRCVKKTCEDEEDPNGYCRAEYGSGYKCVDGVCKLDNCGGIDANCPDGYYCPENECIWGCRDKYNCPDAKPHCSVEGSCVECWGSVHCGAGYSCRDYVCIKQEGCLRQDSLCPKNEYCNVSYCEEGCRDNGNCAEATPQCSQKTGKCEECIYDKHCEAGYDCENYKCVWVGFDCSRDSECPTNWFCHDMHFCVFGCNISDENCAKETPHCSQKTGKCEECWSSEHCEWWQECDETYRCVARKDYAECIPGETKHGKRCRDGIWVKIECKGPEDCLGHEYCDNGLCRDRERGCEMPTDCPSGYYCDLSSKLVEFHKCVKQICRSHEECPVGQGCDYAEFGWSDRDNAKTSCISWRDFYCSDEDPCPEEGWVCDRASGKCVEALCGPGRACQDDRYECVDSICVPRMCEDRPDPLAYCMGEKGWYGRCVSGACVVLDCGWYPDPDLMCQDTEGENWRCVEKRCIDFGAEGVHDPKHYCSELLGVAEAFWDYDKRACEVPDCNTVDGPDKLCAQLKDPRYKCRDGECRRGREGEECERRENCITGLRCAGGLCMEKECIRWQDCDDPEKWCNHGVCEPLRGECAGPEDCRDDYHCDAGGQCVPNDCDDHYDCGEGECCNKNGECVRCETMTCWFNFHCRRGWRCNLETNKCQRVGCARDSECEEGYYCDLDDGICRKIKVGIVCWDNSGCPEGQECKGARGKKWVQKGWPFGTIQKEQPGICVDKGVQIIRIEGIDDERTCDYCRYMWTRIIKEGEGNLPPYHEHCRCFGVYED